MNYVFPPPPPVSVPVAGGNTLFPVRRVYCVGRNYADHAAEMGADGREPPFFFSKPSDALVPGGGDVAYPLSLIHILPSSGGAKSGRLPLWAKIQ